jgi:hypothetical protein
MILSECQEKQEVRLYAPFNRHWESVGIKSTGSIPVVHPINFLYKSMAYGYFRQKYWSLGSFWAVLL